MEQNFPKSVGHCVESVQHLQMCVEIVFRADFRGNFSYFHDMLKIVQLGYGNIVSDNSNFYGEGYGVAKYYIYLKTRS